MNNINVEIKILDEELYKESPLPKYETEGAAAIDLIAADAAVLRPGQCVPIPTGIAVSIPPGYAGLVLPRSGLGAKSGIVLGNLTGLIDSDYRGPVMCYMWNRNSVSDKKQDKYIIQRGERFAQMVFVEIPRATLKVVKEFSTSTERGEGGFGSTGT